MKPIDHKHLTEPVLADVIRQAVRDENLHADATRMSNLLNNENGVERAVEILEKDVLLVYSKSPVS